MEDDEQNDRVEVLNDEEDGNEEGVLMDTPRGDETVQQQYRNSLTTTM